MLIKANKANRFLVVVASWSGKGNGHKVLDRERERKRGEALALLEKAKGC